MTTLTAPPTTVAEARTALETATKALSDAEASFIASNGELTAHDLSELKHGVELAELVLTAARRARDERNENQRLERIAALRANIDAAPKASELVVLLEAIEDAVTQFAKTADARNEIIRTTSRQLQPLLESNEEVSGLSMPEYERYGRFDSVVIVDGEFESTVRPGDFIEPVLKSVARMLGIDTAELVKADGGFIDGAEVFAVLARRGR